jgi:DNA-binding IclR family transcriptional regulator
MTCAEIAQASSLSQDEVRQALDTLMRHDIVQRRAAHEDERYVYTVELMRRWVAQRQVPSTERTEP